MITSNASSVASVRHESTSVSCTGSIDDTTEFNMNNGKEVTMPLHVPLLLPLLILLLLLAPGCISSLLGCLTKRWPNFRAALATSSTLLQCSLAFLACNRRLLLTTVVGTSKVNSRI